MTSTAPRTVLITGAARRIGRALALDFAAKGWRVGVHFGTSQVEAEALVAKIGRRGGASIALQADLNNLADATGLLPACAKALGSVSCLINNASRFERDEASTLSQEEWEAHQNINLRAPVFLAKALADDLPERMSGNVINVIDQRVWRLTPDFFSYTISKSGLWTATRTLAQALAPRIRVNAIGPGPTMASKRQSDEGFARQKEAVLLKRGPGLEEICATAQFILAAPSMTGQMIALDGGQHLAWQTPDVTGIGE